MNVLDAVKNSLRLEGIDEYDSELEALIAACDVDLRIAGVKEPYASMPMYTQACTFYCKANFGQGGGDEERWSKCYELLKRSFALASMEEL